MNSSRIGILVLLGLASLGALKSQGETCANVKGKEPADPCSDVRGNPFWVYNGNVTRTVTDLELADGVGSDKLSFQRIAASRRWGDVVSEFGTGGNWRHSYFWKISQYYENTFGPVLTVDYPNGMQRDFWRNSSVSLYFQSSDSVKDQILMSGSNSNQYYLLKPDGNRVAFYRSSNGQFQVQGLYDPYERFYAFGYDGQGRLKRVSDPCTNHYLELNYDYPTNSASPGWIDFSLMDSNATSVVIAATWNGCSFQTTGPCAGSPVISSDPAGLAQNNVGDWFNLNTNGGAWITTWDGHYQGFGSLGEVYMNYDATNFYIGGMGCLIQNNSDAMILFLGFDSLNQDATNLWQKTGPPYGLDYLHNIHFERPMDIAILLGDEYGDGNYTNFNLGSGYDFGQGVYYLGGTGSFVGVPGIRISQFDGTGTNATLTTNDDGDQLTDRWQVSIPWSALGTSNIAGVSTCVVAGILVNQAVQGTDRYTSGRYLGEYADAYFAGNHTLGYRDNYNNFGYNFVTLRGARARLPGTTPYWDLIETDNDCVKTNAGMTNKTPVVTAKPSSGNQNNIGDAFDLSTNAGVFAAQGTGFGDFGRVALNYDANYFYIGAEGCQMQGPGNAMMLFLDFDTLTDNANQVWSKSGAPYGLDHLHNVWFARPMDIAIMLADEWGDDNYYDFNLESGYNFGQGVYYLGGSNGFVSVSGARVSQFDGSGTNATTATDGDGNRQTDRWEVRIPWSALNASNISSISQCVIGGLFASDGVSGSDRYLSGRYIGDGVAGQKEANGNYGFNFISLTGSCVRLPSYVPVDDADYRMTYAGNGLWTGRVYLTSGSYEYKFVVNGTNWVADTNNPSVNTQDDNSSQLWFSPEMLVSVAGSDGREVRYDYDVRVINGVGHAALIAARYGDGTAAQYRYSTPPPVSYVRPTLTGADDPMIPPPYSRVAYSYQHENASPEAPFGVAGMLYEERHLVTSQLIARLNVGASGYFNTVEDAAGNTATYDYSAANLSRVTGITNEAGEIRQFSYNTNTGLRTSYTTPWGETISYGVTPAFGAVTSRTSSAGGARRWTFTDNSYPVHLAQEVDELGRVTAYTRDASNRITRADYPDGSYETFTYNAYGQVQSQRKRDGSVWSNSYDGLGRQIAAMDPLGHATRYAYDSRGRVSAISNALGYVTQLAYDWRGQVTNVNYPDGTQERIAYDEYGAETNRGLASGGNVARTYDEWGRPVSITDPLGNATLYQYDSQGRLLRTTYPSGLIVSNAYDAAGRKTREYFSTDGTSRQWNYSPSGVHTQYDRLGRATRYEYDLHGWKVREIRPGGSATGYGYDLAGNVTSQTNALGEVLTFSYDAANRLATVTDCRGFVTSNRYDGLGRLVETKDPGGISEQRTYDAAGNLTAITRGGLLVQSNKYNALGWLVETRDANGLVVSNTYDPMGRLLRTYAPDGTFFEKHYSNTFLAMEVDRGGRATTYQRDLLGRVTNQVDHAGYHIGYRYDALGNVTNLLDQKGNLTTFTFDAEGRKTSRIFDDFSNEHYQYDGEGRLTAKRDCMGRWTFFGYDVNGNLTSINYSSDPDVTFEYDALDRRTKMIDGIGTTTWAYVEGCTKETSVDGPFQNDTVLYGYDGKKRLTNLTYCGMSVGYGFDSLDRIASVSAPEGVYFYTYAGNGRLPAELQRPNGVKTVYQYDGLSRLTNLVHQKSTGEALLSFAYTYDGHDQRTRVVREDGRYIDYGYDPIGQLTSAEGKMQDGSPWPGYSFHYAYDPAGNPTSKVENGFITVSEYNDLNQITTSGWSGVMAVMGSLNITDATVTVNGQPASLLPDNSFAVTNLGVVSGTNVWTALATDLFGRTATSLVSVVASGKTYSHDPNGNLAYDGEYAYVFDNADRLVEVRNLATSLPVMQCRYDGTGRRREKIEILDGVRSTNRYVYDNWNVVGVLDGGNGIVEQYSHGPDLSGSLGQAGGIGGILNCRQDGKDYAFHFDGIGNLVGSSINGLLYGRITHAPFGKYMIHKEKRGAEFQFSSKESDLGGKLAYYGYRSYSTEQERWINRDPLNELGDLNLYTFVWNNPLLFVDPIGLYGQQPWYEKIWEFLNTADQFVEGLGDFAADLLTDPCYRESVTTEFWKGVNSDLSQRTVAVELLDALPFHIPTLLENMMNEATWQGQAGVFAKGVALDIFQALAGSCIQSAANYQRLYGQLPNSFSAMVNFGQNIKQQVVMYNQFTDFYTVAEMANKQINK